MSANLNKSDNYTTNEKGQSRFASGNKIGRMKKKGYTLADLTKVAMQYDKTHDESILKHYINMLFSDNKLLDKFIDRYVPTKTINELTGKDGSPIKYIIEKTYEGEDGKPKE